MPRKFCLSIFILFSLLLAACQTAAPSATSPVSQTASPTANLTPVKTNPPTTQSTPTPEIMRVPTDTPDEIDQNCCANYQIGLLGAPTTLNYWRYLGEDQNVWTGYVLADEAPRLYEFPALRAANRLDFVPALALGLPPQAEQRDDLWVIPVKLLESVAWSDGEPLTAHDLVFTVQTVFALQLGGRWADYYTAENLAAVEALDDYTVAFYFYEDPGLSQWQFAAAIGPILPQHYWSPYVEAALTYIDGVTAPEHCDGVLAGTRLVACQAYARARQALYEVEPVSAPSGGGYHTISLTADTVRRQANPHFYAADFKVSLYADGTWARSFPDGTQQQFYGPGAGEPILSYRRGPHSDSVKMTVYATPKMAYDALKKGRVDIVLNPDGLTDDWLRQTAGTAGLYQHLSPQNGLAYLAFNLRRSPFDQLAFRLAVEALIDQEKIVQKDLAGMAFPAYTIIPANNKFWHHPELVSAAEPASAQARLELALQILADAGWSWKVVPAWDAAAKQIIPGEELRTPDGNPMPETNFIFPAPEEDLLMAAFGQEIVDLLLVLGIPLRSESLPRDAIINRTLIAGGSFDLYLLNWRFPLYPGYVCALFESQNDTLLTGGYNTTGYTNPDFDAHCTRFLKENMPQAAQEQAYQLQALLTADRPYIPLFHSQVVDMAREQVIFPYLPDLNGLAGAGGLQTDVRVMKK